MGGSHSAEESRDKGDTGGTNKKGGGRHKPARAVRSAPSPVVSDFRSGDDDSASTLASTDSGGGGGRQRRGHGHNNNNNNNNNQDGDGGDDAAAAARQTSYYEPGCDGRHSFDGHVPLAKIQTWLATLPPAGTRLKPVPPDDVWSDGAREERQWNETAGAFELTYTQDLREAPRYVNALDLESPTRETSSANFKKKKSVFARCA